MADTKKGTQTKEPRQRPVPTVRKGAAASEGATARITGRSP